MLYKVVREASPDRVVRNGAKGLYKNFLRAAKELVADGADGITTNCGFLALFQDELTAALDVPVATSSLMQIPTVERILPRGKRVGLLTISPETLSSEHLLKARCAADTPIGGTPASSHFASAILNNEMEFDPELARQDNIDAALELQSKYPELGAIVLECTNMVPYAADIQQATGLPVFSIYNLVLWLQAGLQPRRNF